MPILQTVGVLGSTVKENQNSGRKFGGFMTDGHTKEGAWIVKLELSEDQVQQLARLLDMAKMMADRKFDIQAHPETFDILAYRAFLQEILVLLRDAIKEQRPN